ncbi:hypothetical protein MKEN_01211100 [Mycena kentingensis (nom. inval.)]|nr:hypothetical protein MKEN_01211100 [Mycena kentingensis (nom. inval.)]
MWPRASSLTIVALGLVARRVVAQSSNVTTCLPAYSWAINERKQSPCLVAAYMENVCQSGLVQVNEIPPSTHYTGPTSAEANLCRCSTPVYSLISACAGCQSRSFLSWTDWAQNCEEVQIAKFLQAVPSQVVVPPWAYINVTQTDNIFSPLAASANASATPPSSSSASPSDSPSSTVAAPPAESNTAIPVLAPTATSEKKVNAGAIAGGVVGGLAFLVAGGLLASFFMRRRKTGVADRHYPNTTSSFSVQPQLTGSSGIPATAPRASPATIAPYPYHQHSGYPKDTSETGTYPGSPVASIMQHTSYDTPSIMSVPITPAVQIVRRYNGAPEV